MYMRRRSMTSWATRPYLQAPCALPDTRQDPRPYVQALCTKPDMLLLTDAQ